MTARTVHRSSAIWAALFGAAIMVVAVSGCGGCYDESNRSFGGKSQEDFVKALKEKKQREAEADREIAQASKRPVVRHVIQATPPEPQPAESGNGSANAAGAVSGAKGESSEGESEQQHLPPPLPPPEDLRLWDEHDFHVAKLRGDRRLIDALAKRAEQLTRTDSEAAMILSLLLPGVDGPAFALGDRGSAAVEQTELRRLYQVACQALATNGTSRARQILLDLLFQRLPVSDARAAAEETLKALADCNADWTRKVLVDLAFSGGATAGAAGSASEQLRQQLFTLVRSGGSRELREYMARTAIEQSNSDQAAYRSVVATLSEPKWENLPAQVLLYRSARLDDTQRPAFEQHFAAWSRRALAQWLGLPALRDEQTLDSAMFADVVRWVWDDRFASFLEVRFQALNSLAEGSTLLALGVTIPTATMRQRLLRTFDRHFSDGPAILRAVTIGSNSCYDPVLIAMIREVIRENARNAKSPRPPMGSGTANAAANARMIELWGVFEYELLRHQCRVFSSAALTRLTEQRGMSLDAGTEKSGPANGDGNGSVDESVWPIPLHPSAHVVLKYEVDRIGADAPAAGTAAPLRLAYSRMEEKGRAQRALAHYRRQIRSINERRSEGGFWLSGRLDAPTGRASFIDVFIMPAKSGMTVSPEEEQQLTIEILAVESDDLTDVLRAIARGG